MEAENKVFNFSDACKELESINDWFQQEDIDLEEALSKYESGLKLVKQCKERLATYENRVVELKKQFTTEEENIPF